MTNEAFFLFNKLLINHNYTYNFFMAKLRVCLKISSLIANLINTSISLININKQSLSFSKVVVLVHYSHGLSFVFKV
jgi:hypothetical protein